MSCASPRRGPWESPIRSRRSWGAMVPSGPVPAPPPPPLSVEPTFTHASHGRKLGMDDTPHSTARHADGSARRDFLKGALLAGGAVASARVGAVAVQAQPGRVPGTLNHYYVPATDKTVHWGYFSKSLKPVVEVTSGDFVTIEVLTHHANDDAERMVTGDPGAESVFYWDKQRKGVDRRGAGPMEPTLFGRGAGEGLGVHICTGPVGVKGAMPGDVLEVRIIDVKPRPCANPQYKGKSFGSNAAAWWGFHYKELMTDPKPREVITIYEVDTSGDRNWAKALYNFQWTPQTDPYGVVHKIIDYPGVPVDHRTVRENHGILKNVRIPIRAHFGVLGLAPSEADIVDSIPPHWVGGNIDDWRIGKGATMYYPVAVPGALLSAGDSRGPGRLRAVRHGHRVLAHRDVPADIEEEGHARRHRARRPRVPAARDAGRVGAARLQLSEVPRGTGRQRAERHLFQVVGGPGAQGRLPQDAPLPHYHARAHRGRGDLAHVDRRGLRHHPGRGRQLGRARHHQEEPVRGRIAERGRPGVAGAPLPHSFMSAGVGPLMAASGARTGRDAAAAPPARPTRRAGAACRADRRSPRSRTSRPSGTASAAS